MMPARTIWALFHLHCVLLADPAHADALYRTGMIHINRGETHEAKHYFDRADRAAATSDEDLLAYLLGDAARSVLDQDALDATPLTSPEPGESGEYLPPGRHYERTFLAVIWTRQGQVHDQAKQADNRDPIEWLERALQRDSTRADLRCELGRRYMAQGDYATAYVPLFPFDPRAARQLLQQRQPRQFSRAGGLTRRRRHGAGAPAGSDACRSAL